MQIELKNTPNLEVHADSAEDLVLNSSSTEILGVKSGRGEIFEAKKVIITTGTFLRGVIHLGLKKYAAGRHVRDRFAQFQSECSISPFPVKISNRHQWDLH